MWYKTKPLHKIVVDSPIMRPHDVYDYGDTFKKYTCFEPFKRLELHDSGDVTICCRNWASYTVGNWKLQSLKEIWMGARADIFRRSVAVERDFRFCNCSACPRLQDPDKRFNITSKQQEILKSWEQGHIIPTISELHIGIDRSCQLECPSCRQELIYHGNILKEKPALLQLANDIIDLYNKGEITRISASGSGDPFISPFCKKIMNEIVGVDGSAFRIATNGLGFTKQWYDQHPNMHRLINDIEVSMDAGTDETYNIVRKGGNWKILQRNLEFISTLNIRTRLNIVVQKLNYREIPLMLELCKKYNFKLSLKKILPWSSAQMQNFDDIAIWQVDHPDHHIFVEILQNLDYSSGHLITHDLTSYIRELKLID
jgi:MoaA/NifB/PqqE/SkfB family radical SAM enzyme